MDKDIGWEEKKNSKRGLSRIFGVKSRQHRKKAGPARPKVEQIKGGRGPQIGDGDLRDNQER